MYTVVFVDGWFAADEIDLWVRCSFLHYYHNENADHKEF